MLDYPATQEDYKAQFCSVWSSIQQEAVVCDETYGFGEYFAVHNFCSICHGDDDSSNEADYTDSYDCELDSGSDGGVPLI